MYETLRPDGEAAEAARLAKVEREELPMYVLSRWDTITKVDKSFINIQMYKLWSGSIEEKSRTIEVILSFEYEEYSPLDGRGFCNDKERDALKPIIEEREDEVASPKQGQLRLRTILEISQG